MLVPLINSPSGERSPRKGRVRGAMLQEAGHPGIAPLTLTLSPEGRGDEGADEREADMATTTARYLPLDGGGQEGVAVGHDIGAKLPPTLDPSPQGGGCRLKMQMQEIEKAK